MHSRRQLIQPRPITMESIGVRALSTASNDVERRLRENNIPFKVCCVRAWSDEIENTCYLMAEMSAMDMMERIPCLYTHYMVADGYSFILCVFADRCCCRVDLCGVFGHNIRAEITQAVQLLIVEFVSICDTGIRRIKIFKILSSNKLILKYGRIFQLFIYWINSQDTKC